MGTIGYIIENPWLPSLLFFAPKISHQENNITKKGIVFVAL